jgi:SAM-dependent methyltransferase
MNDSKYLHLTLSEEDIAAEEYKSHLGGGEAQWERRGAYQLELLKYLGLRPGHRFVDYGCGPIRAGRYFIRYLDRGCYLGCDVNADFVKVADQIVSEAPDLANKDPILWHAPDMLADLPPYDVMLFFSVLNFCKKRDQKKVLERARNQPEGAVIWITHAHWVERFNPKLLEGVRVTRLDQNDLPEELRIDRHGWNAEDVSRVFPIIGLRRV